MNELELELHAMTSESFQERDAFFLFAAFD